MQAILEDLTCFLPVTLHKSGLSEAEWISFCERYADFQLEYTAEGNLLIMPGTEPITGRRNAEIARQLGNWTLADARGECFDSSTSFLLPSGARRSADAAWLTSAKYQQILSSRAHYPEVAPDFVIELRSPSDRRRILEEKMEEWIDNGVQVAWLIDPDSHTVDVCCDGKVRTSLLQPVEIAGEGPVAGFRLILDRILV